MNNQIDTEKFVAAMRRTASGVAVIATDGIGGRAGLTVSSFTSLSTAPPAVLFSIHEKSRALRALSINGHFTANVLAVEQTYIAGVFAGLNGGAQIDRFSVGEWSRQVSDSPSLLGAVCSFDCELINSLRCGTHIILTGKVRAIELGGEEPLVYSRKLFYRISQESLPVEQ